MGKVYYLSLTTAALGLLSVVIAVTVSAAVGREAFEKADKKNILTDKYFNIIDIVHEQRVKFAASYGVSNPVELVAAVRNSPMANLLISVAIEESRGDPVAVGASGELGAWQVKPSDWGAVPENIHGQAGQAERIIRGLLIQTKGNKKKALALYNGGTTPPGKSYRYAERILTRAKHLQVAVNYLPPYLFNTLQEALPYPHGTY